MVLFRYVVHTFLRFFSILSVAIPKTYFDILTKYLKEKYAENTKDPEKHTFKIHLGYHSVYFFNIKNQSILNISKTNVHQITILFQSLINLYSNTYSIL